MQWGENQRGELLFELPYSADNIGNTLLPALHGGLIGGFLENAAIFHLSSITRPRKRRKLSISRWIIYVPVGRRTLYAQCEITKLGRRVAHVLIHACRMITTNRWRWRGRILLN